jgi:23S rRNA (uracil1939-C5)-methyltransferase
MPLTTGQELEVLVEKPASGGRMIARHGGEVLLIAGAIPGERVVARVTRAEKRVAFAMTLRVLEPSADRRESPGDPACGGCVYSFIDYPRQLALKSEIIRDAFLRIGQLPLDASLEVTGAAERNYRMRARFHVRDGRPGFYREGSHELCDARQTGQLLEAAIDAVEAAVASLSAQGYGVVSVELSENITADQRALHLDIRDRSPSEDALNRAISAARITGCTMRMADTNSYSAGDPIVSDPLDTLTGGRATEGTLRRHPEAFFQANRFLIPSLVGTVLDNVHEGSVVDLYAGVGLFSVALAALGRQEITAVEGDPASSRDLLRNAAPYPDRLRVHRSSVEAYLARSGAVPGTLIVDPPRTGMSKEATDAIVRAGARRIVYVSCDAPTMARDARRLLDAGYRLTHVRGFDLFPNTPHVETVGVFEGGVKI